MKKIINEKTLRGIIKQHISEALNYDKDIRRYSPKYTGDPHSDAGRFASINRGDFEYSHNDYKWSNPENQRRFEDLQWENDLEPDTTRDYRDIEDNAEEYLNNHDPYTVVENAVNELKGEFENMIGDFIAKAAEKYPIFKERYYMGDLLYHLRDILRDYDY